MSKHFLLILIFTCIVSFFLGFVNKAYADNKQTIQIVFTNNTQLLICDHPEINKYTIQKIKDQITNEFIVIGDKSIKNSSIKHIETWKGCYE